MPLPMAKVQPYFCFRVVKRSYKGKKRTSLLTKYLEVYKMFKNFRRYCSVLLFSSICIFAFSFSSLAAPGKVEVTLTEDDSPPVSSIPILISKEDALTWTVTNTSTEDGLFYSILNIPTEIPADWDRDPMQLTFGYVSPGETVMGFKMGKEIVFDYSKDERFSFTRKEMTANNFFIKLFGPGSGKAELNNTPFPAIASEE